MISPRPTRRHWLREVRDWCHLRWMDLTSFVRGASGKLSMFRLVLALFSVQFAGHWPDPWDTHAVAALAILVFALPLEELTRRVPVSEALGAVQSFFSMLGARAAAKEGEAREVLRAPRIREGES